MLTFCIPLKQEKRLLNLVRSVRSYLTTLLLDSIQVDCNKCNKIISRTHGYQRIQPQKHPPIIYQTLSSQGPSYTAKKLLHFFKNNPLPWTCVFSLQFIISFEITFYINYLGDISSHTNTVAVYSGPCTDLSAVSSFPCMLLQRAQHIQTL